MRTVFGRARIDDEQSLGRVYEIRVRSVVGHLARVVGHDSPHALGDPGAHGSGRFRLREKYAGPGHWSRSPMDRSRSPTRK